MTEYRSALILGFGRSGRAAEALLQSEGCATVVASDDRMDDAAFFQCLETVDFDVCIVSPGFALDHPWMIAVQGAEIPLLSELELGWSRHKGKTIALTGSNGKSTAVKWICESLVASGLKAEIGGNYGIPASEVVLEYPDLDWLVLEVSSFQLETVREFYADIAVVLNVLPNHLNRHGTMTCYLETKARIFGISEASRICVIPHELLSDFRGAVSGERNWVTFGAGGVYQFCSGQVFHGLKNVLNLTGTLFDSPVIGSCTGAAAAAAFEAGGLEMQTLERSAKSFKPLRHRLQRLGEVRGVFYVNDSKATNLAAMTAALGAIGRDIHLIAGGLPKESDYTFVKEILAERVRTIYVIGQASRAMFEAWSTVCPCVECGTLEEAFGQAAQAAEAGETVLLSPACASFDQFDSFEERGECFERLFNGVKHAG
ncbi:UDP-N-acetylmuramoyl-L-alanine--D-glutamate ligase [Pontiella agarivorans]|uniref:UDP-N-acetylmuramoylalanine--D-glutamate ligase n=1 Tax=Pontiella agarivorans TaxID=3038953 RepID=A0ABU5MSL5_9BACT|nr:UDP-N-acetylmuramoyl-L-alanine--D-glutamate ligase [Pontiella agarivorans]MDZ8117122.1 UDP-N-acetylmuramoyl-L-alanine--D-glutamate ligase [Pontiella agarivorans]